MRVVGCQPEVVHGDVAALMQISERDGAPNARGAACDSGGFAGEETGLGERNCGSSDSWECMLRLWGLWSRLSAMLGDKSSHGDECRVCF